MTPETRALRADAQRNHDAIVVAANEAFLARGVGASLEGIAKAAGVGTGTLYRHFPVREDLIEAVYRREFEGVADAAAELVAEGRSGMDALRAWTDRFVDYAITKRGLGDALRTCMERAPQTRSDVASRLEGALELLVSTGIADGSIRDDAQAIDVLRAMTAIFHIPHVEGWVEQSRRILGLLLDGLERR